MKPSIKRLISFSAMSIIIAGTIIGNVIADTHESQINAFLCAAVVNNETRNQSLELGQALSKQIVEEGSVLLKNDNNTLPLSLDNDSKVNVFGYGSVEWVYHGEGSGRVRDENGDESQKIDFIKALKRYGVSVNDELQDMYLKYKKPEVYIDAINSNIIDYVTNPSINDKKYYSDSLLENAKNYSDTAFVIISRHGTEGRDASKTGQKKYNASPDTTRTYLDLSSEEEELITYVSETYKKVVVIINSTNIMNLSFLETIPNIGACMMVGPTGTKGATSVPKLLYGEVSPSGKTVDTIAYDFKSNPNYEFTGNGFVNKYTGASGTYGNVNYTDYVEGIYVGYKWYETADVEHIWDDVNNEFGKGYEGIVQFPFGYGLSYTNFENEIEKITPEIGSSITNETEIEIDVKVTNVGATKGKEVVQAYVTLPYTKGQIEKTAIQLCAMEKTIEIEPNQSQVVTLKIDADDFKSYDCYDKNNNNFKGYELEKGDYQVKIMHDSHNIADVTYDNKVQKGVFNFKVDETLKLSEDKVTGQVINNKFTGADAIDGASLDGIEADGTDNGIKFISRNEFPNPFEFKNSEPRAITDIVKEMNVMTKEWAQNWDNAETDVYGNPVHNEKVTWNAKNGLKVFENGQVTELGLKLGKDYNDPEWEKLLDQLSISEVTSMIGPSYGTSALNSIGKPFLAEYDGPSQIRGFTSAPRGTGYPSQTMLAQTWSKQLAYQFGLSYGSDMGTLNVSGTWAPGCNIHRSPFGGRNFEYYSEDTFLTSEMAYNASRGFKNTGRYVYLKHFVLNDMEVGRMFMYTWCSEQTLRETYLKAFEKSIKTGTANGIMTTYGRIGGCYTGGSEALIAGVVRTEWQFNGAIISDFSNDNRFMNVDHGIRGGSDLGMGCKLNNPSTPFTLEYSSSSSNRLQYRLREVAHHVTWSWLNSMYAQSIYDPSKDGTSVVLSTKTIEPWMWWRAVIVDLDVLVGFGCLFWTYWLFRKKLMKEEK